MAQCQQHQQQRRKGNHGDINRQSPPAPVDALRGAFRWQAKRSFQLTPAIANQVKTGGSLYRVCAQAVGHRLGCGDNRLSRFPFCFLTDPRQLFNGPGDLLAREFAFLAKAGQLPQHLQGQAYRLYQVDPVNLADQAQGGDDVADCQVGRHLGALAFKHQRMSIGTMLFDPLHQRGRVTQQLGRHSLPQLGQVTALQAAFFHQCIDGIQVSVVQHLFVVPDRMGDFERYLALGDIVSHAAQVFKQDDAQGGGQGPQLAQAKFATALVRVEKCGKNFRVQHAVGMRHISPGNAIHARQSLQRRDGKFRQAGVKTPWHALPDLLQLGFD